MTHSQRLAGIVSTFFSLITNINSIFKSHAFDVQNSLNPSTFLYFHFYTLHLVTITFFWTVPSCLDHLKFILHQKYWRNSLKNLNNVTPLPYTLWRLFVTSKIKLQYSTQPIGLCYLGSDLFHRFIGWHSHPSLFSHQRWLFVSILPAPPCSRTFLNCVLISPLSPNNS